MDIDYAIWRFSVVERSFLVESSGLGSSAGFGGASISVDSVGFGTAFHFGLLFMWCVEAPTKELMHFFLLCVLLASRIPFHISPLGREKRLVYVTLRWPSQIAGRLPESTHLLHN